MNKSGIRVAMAEARNCALVMLESATFIRSQLGSVRMNDALQTQTEQVCAALVGTKHDIISELFELDGLLGSNASAAVVVSRLNRLVQWLWEPITQMHELVMTLQSVRNQDPEYELAYILVAESATNILKAFVRTREAVESLRAAAGGGSND